MKKFMIVVLGLALSNASFAANDKKALTDKMVSACKADLAKEPALSDTSDSEAVWRNLEDKEHTHVKLSKKCHAAHEKYEAKYHKEDEEHENN
jgi:hypothetical protein